MLLEQLEISPLLDADCLCDVFNGCQKLSEIAFYQDSVFRFPNVVEVVAGAVFVPPLVHAIAADVLQMMELKGRCLTRFLTNLKHVEIPEGITKIGKSCFFDKRGIVSVKLPATLTEIESRAFRNCICLENVQFASSQVHIHEDAFKNCSSKTTPLLHLPESPNAPTPSCLPWFKPSIDRFWGISPSAEPFC